MSLDGFIASKDDDLSWLSIVEKAGEDYGYELFTKTVDTYIVGRVTYETILKPKLSDSTLQFSNLTKCDVFHFAYRQNSYCFGNFQGELGFIHQ